MVKTCCVKNCNIAPKENVTCFRFPNNRFLRRKWIDAIGLSNKLTASSTVCIKHFQLDDYDIVRGRPRLKAKVIPSVLCRSDERTASARRPEDDIVTTEISTEITLKSIRRDNPNLKNDTCIQNEISKKIDKTDGSDEVVSNGSGGELTNNCYNSTVNVCKEVDEKLHNEDETDPHSVSRAESPDACRAVPSEDSPAVSKENISEERNDDRTQNKTEEVELEQTNKTIRPSNGVVTKNKKNGKGYQDSFIESATKASGDVDDLNKDIEDIIVNYQIEQTRPVHAAEAESPRPENGAESGEALDEGFLRESDPVFIELAVQGDKAGSPRDCLMVLESVEVELDPNNFLAVGAPDDADETVDLAGDDDEEDAGRDRERVGRPDPISLLTSSDEDEVIIQEPHIDTVEVSDETDEDDVPLVKLLKKPKKKKKPKITIWNPYEYFCMDCQFTATSRQEYKAHTSKHSTILQVCDVCEYTTASKSQFSRHKRKHKDDRKFKCHLCDYKARHNMSLIYHLKSHRALSSAKKGFKCDKCGFKSDVKMIVLKHVKLCSTNVKKYSCDKCVYETTRPSDLRRHKDRRHKEQDDDEEFVP